jgi:hypothetical protein
MNSFNDEVCEYISTPVTENFRTCSEAGGFVVPNNQCSSGCYYSPGLNPYGGWCIDP